MEETIARLRRQIARCPRNSRGRRQYSVALRQELIELSQAWRKTPSSQRELAERLGLSDQTLATWRYESQKSRRRSSIKKVSVVETVSPPGLEILLTSGHRIIGVDLRTAIEFARAAS